jgi:hypothetical protein
MYFELYYNEMQRTKKQMITNIKKNDFKLE